MPRPNTYEDIAGTGITVITTAKGDAFLIETANRETARRHCWSRHEHGYARAVTRTAEGLKTVYLHRLLCRVSDEAPHVDHINGDPADGRAANLRSCNRVENLRNQKLRMNSRTGAKVWGSTGRPASTGRASSGAANHTLVFSKLSKKRARLQCRRE